MVKLPPQNSCQQVETHLYPAKLIWEFLLTEIKNVACPIMAGKKISFFLWRRNETVWTSLVVQRMQVCLPMQGAQVRSWARDDSTCCGAHVPQQLSLRSRVCASMLEKPLQWETCAPQLRAAPLNANRESPCASAKTQCNQKKKRKKETGWLCETVRQTLDPIPRNFEYWTWIFWLICWCGLCPWCGCWAKDVPMPFASLTFSPLSQGQNW